MVIKLDFFKKDSLKWYSSGTIDIDNSVIFQDNLKQEIVNNQNVLVNGWQGNFYVMVDSSEESNNPPFLFAPQDFLGILKTND